MISNRTIPRTCLGSFALALVMIFLPAFCLAGDTGLPDGKNGPAAGSEIHALGRLEPDLGVFDISAASGEKRIQKVLVKEGQKVAKGEPLILLVGYDAYKADVDLLEQKILTAKAQVQRELALRKVRLEEAKARQEITRVQDRDEIRILEHRIVSLTAQVAFRKREMERAKTLNTKEVVSGQDYDERQMELTRTREDLNTAGVALSRQKALAPLNQQKARAEQATILEDSRARELSIGLDTLEKELNFARKKMETFRIPSPVDGEILTIFSRGGGVPGQYPILKMADLSSMVAIAEVYETDLGRVRMDQSAVVTSPALPGKLTGKVIHINRLIFKRTVRDIDPYQPEDYRVAEVKILLDDPDTAARYIQLQVDVALDTR